MVMTFFKQGMWVEGKVKRKANEYSVFYEQKVGYVECVNGVYMNFWVTDEDGNWMDADGEHIEVESILRNVKKLDTSLDEDMKSKLIDMLLTQSKDNTMKPYCIEWLRELVGEKGETV